MLLCPVKTPYRLTQKFGENPNVYNQFGLKGHNGLDFASDVPGKKVPMYCPMEGVAFEVGDQGAKGYGKFIRIRNTTPDATGHLKEVIMGHFDSIDVKQGQFLPLGEKLGVMGTTGFSSGVHLHWGLRFLKDGVVLDYDNGYKGYIDFLPYIIYWS